MSGRLERRFAQRGSHFEWQLGLFARPVFRRLHASYGYEHCAAHEHVLPSVYGRSRAYRPVLRGHHGSRIRCRARPFPDRLEGAVRIGPAESSGSPQRRDEAKRGVDRREPVPTLILGRLEEKAVEDAPAESACVRACAQTLVIQSRLGPGSPRVRRDGHGVLVQLVGERRRARPPAAGRRIHDLHERSVTTPRDDEMQNSAGLSHDGDGG